MTDFSNLAVLAAPPPPERGVTWLNFGPKRVRFTFPESGNIRAHIERIVSGQEYPALRLPGYAPETIVDIGANVGAAALYFHHTFPQAEVYAYEPSAENFRHLAHNAAGLPKIHVFPYGLLDSAQKMKLYAGKEQSMTCSVVQGPETTTQSETIELRSAGEEIERLGPNAPSILKLDTEGCEVPILHSLRSRLEAINFIYVEYHSEEDRREIDRLTEPHFLLTRSHAASPHRGQIMYSSRRIAERYELFDRLRIEGPRPLLGE